MSFKNQIKNMNVSGLPEDLPIVKQEAAVVTNAEVVSSEADVSLATSSTEQKRTRKTKDVKLESAGEERVVLKLSSEVFGRLTALRIKHMSGGKLPSAQQLITDLLLKHLTKEGV